MRCCARVYGTLHALLSSLQAIEEIVSVRRDFCASISSWNGLRKEFGFSERSELSGLLAFLRKSSRAT